MRLWNRLPFERDPGTSSFELRSTRQRRTTLRRLGDELDRRREATPDDESIEVQPLIRVVGSASYEQFKMDQTKAWARQGGRYTTRTWPAAIDEGEFAAVLLPLSAGRVGPALGAQPRATLTPHFSHGRPVATGSYDDIALSLLVAWSNSCPAHIRTAPPVVELMQRGAVVERHLLDFGLTWHLPAPDGI